MIKPAEILKTILLRLVLSDTVYFPDSSLFHHSAECYLILWSLVELVSWSFETAVAPQSLELRFPLKSSFTMHHVATTWP